MENVRRQREEIEILVRGLEGVVSDIEGGVTAMEGVEELKGMSWEMEGVREGFDVTTITTEEEWKMVQHGRFDVTMTWTEDR